MDSSKYSLFLQDLGELIKSEASKVKAKKAQAKSEGDSEFESGQLMGFYSVVSMMKTLAIGFDISDEEMGLENLDPDKDLV